MPTRTHMHDDPPNGNQLPSPPHVLGGTWSQDRTRTLSLGIIAGVALAGGLWAGRDIFVPLAVAATFAAVLRPAVRWLRDRARLPVPAGAALVLLAILGALGAAATSLEQPARDLFDDAPQLFTKARTRLDELRRPLQRVTQAMEGPSAGARTRGAGRRAPAASAAAAGTSGGAPAAIPDVSPSTLGVAIQKLFGTTASLLATTAEVLLLIYFLLAGDDRFLRRIVGGLRDPAAKRTAVEVVRESEAHVARYLGTLLLISAGQGIVVALALWALHVPSPIVWGLATMVFETLPYLGAAIMIAGLTVIGLASTDSIAAALAAPATYLLVSTLQNSFVSPIAYGRRLRLNPFAILCAVLTGYALWGVAGVFLAVPTAAALNVLAEHVEALAPLGAFLRE